jgi:virulence-associated protein VagC
MRGKYEELSCKELGEDTFKKAQRFPSDTTQAIRVPPEFFLPSTEVMIRKFGGTLVIEPMLKVHQRCSLAALLAALATRESLESACEYRR